MVIDQNINPTTLRLMEALREFHRFGWQEHSIAGCKPSEIRLLFCLKHRMQYGNCDMKVSEISKLLHVTSPSVTQLLKGLEANRLIERHNDPVDRRAVGIKLTKQGEDVIRQAMERYTSSLDGLVEYLGKEESEHFATLISKVLRYFSEQEVTMRQSQSIDLRLEAGGLPLVREE